MITFLLLFKKERRKEAIISRVEEVPVVFLVKVRFFFLKERSKRERMGDNGGRVIEWVSGRREMEIDEKKVDIGLAHWLSSTNSSSSFSPDGHRHGYVTQRVNNADYEATTTTTNRSSSAQCSHQTDGRLNLLLLSEYCNNSRRAARTRKKRRDLIRLRKQLVEEGTGGLTAA